MAWRLPQESKMGSDSAMFRASDLLIALTPTLSHRERVGVRAGLAAVPLHP